MTPEKKGQTQAHAWIVVGDSIGNPAYYDDPEWAEYRAEQARNNGYPDARVCPLSDVQRRELLKTSKFEKWGGRDVPVATRAHRALESMGLLYVNVSDPMGPGRIRCTGEGLRVAERLRDEEAES